MNSLNTVAILIVVYLATFAQGSVTVFRDWVGTQFDLLPPLMVYCGLNTGLGTVTLTAVIAGLTIDALSANPLGASVLALFLVGVVVHRARELILRDQPYARLVLGLFASAAAPLITVMVLWAGGAKPLIGWGSLWQWLVITVSGGILTPPCCWLFERLNSALVYSRPTETTFRPDREIKRGRA